jgi:hypothetical protein
MRKTDDLLVYSRTEIDVNEVASALDSILCILEKGKLYYSDYYFK